MKAYPYLNLSGGINEKETQAFAYQVDFTENEYKFQYPTSRPVLHLPSMPFNQDGDHTALLNTLQHIAKFKFFEGIENRMPSQSFESSYKIHCDQGPGEDGYYRVQDGKHLTLKFNNSTGGPKYLAIFSFTPFWEVHNLTAEFGDPCCLRIETGEYKLPLKMSVPTDLQAEGQNQTEDVLKLIITNESTLFPGMILPRINLASLRGETDSLAKLLQVLSSGTPERRNDKRREWATRNYLIRTYI